MKTYLLLLLGLILCFEASAQIASQKKLTTKNQKIYCLAYSHDGNYIATGGDHKEIIIFKNGSWEEIARLKGLKDIPLTLAFSPDGKKIAAGGFDNKVTVWSLASWQVILSLKGHSDQVNDLEFTPNGDHIASCSNDKTIAYWNLNTGLMEKQLIGHTEYVTSIDISPNGDRLVSGSIDKTVKVWDLKSAKLTKNILADNRSIRTVAYSPDGSVIASGGDDGIMHLWDAYSGVKLNTFFGHKQRVVALKYSPDGNYLLSGGYDKIILLTDLGTGKVVFHSVKQENNIKALAFCPTGETFSSVVWSSKHLSIWNARTMDIKPMDEKFAQTVSKKSGMAPLVNILLPTQGVLLPIPSAKVSAQITSESSLRSIRLYLNGQLFAQKDRSDLMMETKHDDIINYEETLVLREGTNTMKITATNIVGEGSSETISLTYSNAPIKLLTWVSPAQPTISSSMSDFDITAMINPAGENQQVDILVNDVSQGLFFFTANGGVLNAKVKLQNGINNIKLKVTTPNYSRFADVRIINYAPATKPVINWVLPSSDTLVNISTARVFANVESKVPLDKVELKVNEAIVFSDSQLVAGTFELSQQIQLMSGVNSVTIHAYNNEGETISKVRNISYRLPAKTNISWIAPASSTDVHTASYDMHACVQSKSPVKKVEFFNNDELIVSEYNPPANTDGECTIDFSRTIILNEGLNQFKVVGVNAGGSTESEYISLNYIPPMIASVNWLSPLMEQTTVTSDVFNISACIKSNTPVRSIEIIVNNQVLGVIQNPIKDEERTGSYTINESLSLNLGINTVSIKVLTQAGETLSSPLSIHYKTTNPYRFALIIGNEDYSSFQPDLNSASDVDFALNDAREFKKMCINSLGFEEDNILYLENARYIEMRKELKKINGIMKVTQGKAELFVFYAGHGFPDGKTKEPYLIPVDGNGNDLEFGVIKLSDFYKELTEYPAKRVTIFLDACFSGGARNQELVSARGVRVVANEPIDALKKNLVVFTASSGSESSLPYQEKQHGMFTYYVLKKINESNGSLTYKDLSEYLKEEVGIRSFMVNSKEQTPQTNISPEIQSEWATWNFFE